MLNDIIHLTQGELFVKYWYVYLVLIIVATALGKLSKKIK